MTTSHQTDDPPTADLPPIRTIYPKYLVTIWGQAKFVRDPIAMLYWLQRKYGNLFQVEFGGRRLVFAFGPTYNRILHAETDRFHGRGVVLAGPENSAQRRLMTSLFALNGTVHQRFRHQLVPAFQKSALAGYAPDLAEEVDTVLSQWHPGKVVDMSAETRQLSWAIARRVLFGLPHRPDVESLRDELEEWFVRNSRPWTQLIRVNRPFTPYGQLLRRAEAIEQRVLALIRQKRDEGLGHDVLSMLMRARNEAGVPATDAELVGHVITLFLASYETTANTLAWTLFLLAQHPEIASSLCDELATTPMDGTQPADLDRLPLLGRVLKESMRILPVVPVSRRWTTRDGDFNGFHLPAQSMVVFSHYLTHHMPDLYPDPEKFLPERWETINPSLAEYLPFGAGARICIGAAFATYSLKLMLTTILRRWRFSVVPGAQIDRRVKVTLAPKHGLPMRIGHATEGFHRVQVRGNIHEMVDLTAPTQAFVRTRAA